MQDGIVETARLEQGVSEGLSQKRSARSRGRTPSETRFKASSALPRCCWHQPRSPQVSGSCLFDVERAVQQLEADLESSDVALIRSVGATVLRRLTSQSRSVGNGTPRPRLRGTCRPVAANLRRSTR